MRTLVNTRRHVLLIATMASVLAACGGGNTDSPTPVSSTADAADDAKSSVAAAAPVRVRIDTNITPSMLRKVSAPPKPNNGKVDVQPGLGGKDNHDHEVVETAMRIHKLRNLNRLTGEAP